MVKYNDLKKVIIVKLGNPEEVDEELLKISYDEAVQTIKNYCSIENIPLGLFHTLTNICRDLYLFYSSFSDKSEEGSGETSSSISIEDVSSIKMGDTTISLREGAEDSSPLKRDYSNMHNYDIDKLTETYADSLNEYRRMVW